MTRIVFLIRDRVPEIRITGLRYYGVKASFQPYLNGYFPLRIFECILPKRRFVEKLSAKSFIFKKQSNNFLSTDYRRAKPADLLFFGKTVDRVTHVVISLGDERFIHAGGWVKINSFRETDDDISDYHLRTFISVNRYSA